MNKITNKFCAKRIEELYELKEILPNGQIELKTRKITIYKIDPANIIACDENAKQKIYQAYLTCIRSLPDTFQMVISKEKVNFNTQIKEYKKRLDSIESGGLRDALKKYIEYLEKLYDVNQFYKTKHYLIINNIERVDKSDILNIFANLREFGIIINAVEDEKSIEEILRQSFLKEGVKWDY